MPVGAPEGRSPRRGGTCRRAAARRPRRPGRRRSRTRTRRRAPCGTATRSGAGRSCAPGERVRLRRRAARAGRAGRAASASGCSRGRTRTGVATGGRCEMRAASAVGTPCATRPGLQRVRAAPEARPTIISVKKTPIESTLAEFMNVASIPAPAPRCGGGSAFITPALFGDANRPIPIPFSSRTSANQTYAKSTGSTISRQEAERGEQHPAGRERARAVAVGEPARRPGRRRGSRRSAGACRCPAQSGVCAKS